MSIINSPSWGDAQCITNASLWTFACGLGQLLFLLFDPGLVVLDHFGVFAPLPPATRRSHTTQLCHTPSFTHNFHKQLCSPPPLTHHLSHTTLSHTIFPPPSPLSFLPSPSPLQHLLLIIGRSWLVGLSGPLIFKVFALWFGTCNLKSSSSAVSSCQEICRYGRFLKFQERLGPGVLRLKKWCFELTASKSAHETEADISKHKAQVTSRNIDFHISYLREPCLRGILRYCVRKQAARRPLNRSQRIFGWARSDRRSSVQGCTTTMDTTTGGSTRRDQRNQKPRKSEWEQMFRA